MQHPVFYALVRLRARGELRRKVGLFRAGELMDGCDDDVIDAAVLQSQVTPPADAAGVAAIGDGTIIDAIIDFLRSDAGQALIQALVALLLSLLAA